MLPNNQFQLCGQAQGCDIKRNVMSEMQCVCVGGWITVAVCEQWVNRLVWWPQCEFLWHTVTVLSGRPAYRCDLYQTEELNWVHCEIWLFYCMSTFLCPFSLFLLLSLCKTNKQKKTHFQHTDKHTLIVCLWQRNNPTNQRCPFHGCRDECINGHSS